MIKNILLINTRSRRGREMKPTIKSTLEEYGVVVDKIIEINKRTNVKSTLQRIKRYAPQLLIVCGGDGTVNNVIGYFHDTPMRLAIIPGGTTNNLARSLEIPFDVEGAVEAMKKYQPQTIDVGIMNNKVVSNVMGIGVSASIAKNVTNRAKKRFGRFAYGVVGLVQVFRHKAFNIKIYDLDKEFEVHLRTHQLIIANGRFHGGKEIVATNSLDNGQLVLFTIGGKSRISLLLDMISYYVKSRDDYSHPLYFIGRHVKIEIDRPERIEIDGEASTKRVRIVEAKTIKSKMKVYRA